MPSWIDYWNSDHPIYVNDRHKALHASGLANDFRRHVKSPHAQVLDFGCGEALYAEEVARFCGRLTLSDAAPAVRAKVAERVKAIPTILVQSAEETAAMPDASFDLIVVNSVAQYLTVDQLAGFMPGWRRMLKPDGRLVLADIIPPNVSPVTDAAALLSFAWKGGFVGAALAGLVKTALSDYRKIRGELGFTTHSEADLLPMLARAGLRGERVYPNFGHNQARMTFVAKVVA
ncbi:MAG: class I SAM-dependent methyltransferase [Caldilineaceae bacterium]